MIRATIHFPTYPNSKKPLRTGFDANAQRPGIVAIYKRVNGRMRLVGATLPKEAIR